MGCRRAAVSIPRSTTIGGQSVWLQVITYTFSAATVAGLTDNLNDVAIDLRDSSRTILRQPGCGRRRRERPPRALPTRQPAQAPHISTSAPAVTTPPVSSATTRSLSPTTATDTVLDTASTNASLTIGGGANLGTIDAVPESGSFNTSVDHDWFAVNLTAGHDYAFSAQGFGQQLARCCDRSQGFQPDNSRQPGRGRCRRDRPSFNYTAISSGTEYLDISAGASTGRQNRQLLDHRLRLGQRHGPGHGIDQRQPHDGRDNCRQDRCDAGERQFRHLTRPRLVRGQSDCRSRLHVLGAGLRSA